MTPLLRIAAIDFLNPAPLMWDFEHGPRAAELGARYALESMTPAECARALAGGVADLGLIPAAAWAVTPGLSIAPGCTIASLDAIRSILLVLRTAPGDEESAPAQGEEPELTPPTKRELARIQTVALDTASRTSVLYTQVLFRRYWSHTPAFVDHAADLDTMLRTADAALLIGDPALHALRERDARFARTGERLRYLDLGHLWYAATGTAWVSAFWGVRDEALARFTAAERAAVQADLLQSRDAGLANIPALVAEWSPRLGLHPETVHTYLSRNIHYVLDDACIAGLQRFFADAHQLDLLPAIPELRFMQ